jgi:hypothetical protein
MGYKQLFHPPGATRRVKLRHFAVGCNLGGKGVVKEVYSVI